MSKFSPSGVNNSDICAPRVPRRYSPEEYYRQDTRQSNGRFGNLGQFNQATSSSYKSYLWNEIQENLYKKYLHRQDHNSPETSGKRACNISQDEHLQDKHLDAPEDVHQFDHVEDEQDNSSISDNDFDDEPEENDPSGGGNDQEDNPGISKDDESFAAYDDDNPVYVGSKITVAQSLLLLIYFIMRHNITKACVQDLLTLINFHAPQFQDPGPSSVHIFSRTLNLTCDDVQKHFFCPSCQSYLGKLQEEFECENCNNNYTAQDLITEKGFFLDLPVKQQLKDKFNDHEFFSNINYKWKRKKQDINNIKDVFDGEMYKSVKPLNDPLRDDLSLS
ncbi:hypothetical protein HOLleu_26902 [Holothuria leucospilota]|uniref:Uncharacterized protein n=1 Tax=Holothuria leucospilota TaxID=206669 RepID=A0A9Q1BPI0_HOLLE|nr:hypothetical protein HOLleu_26902 [Holothuria leucospilota]